MHFDVCLQEQTLLNKIDDKCYTVHLQCFNCLSILFCPLFNFSVLFVTHSIPVLCILALCRCLCICVKQTDSKVHLLPVNLINGKSRQNVVHFTSH